MKLKKYEAHVFDECTSNEKKTRLSFCGERLHGFYFTGPDHVIYNAMAQGRLLPCKRCHSRITEILKSARPDQKPATAPEQEYPCPDCQGGGCPTCQGYGHMKGYYK